MLQDEEIKQISDETGFSPTQIEKLYSRFSHLDRSNCGALSKNDLLSIPELAINPLCDRLIQMFFSDCHQEDERINFRQFMRVLAAFKLSSNSNTNHINNNDNSIEINTQPNPAKNRQAASSMSAPKKQSTTATKTRASSNPSLNPNGHIKANSLVDTLNDGLKNKLLFVFKIYDADNDGRISFSDLRSILKMMVGNYIEDVQLDKIATRAFVEVDQDSDGFIEFSEFCQVFAGKDLDDKLRVKFFD